MHVTACFTNVRLFVQHVSVDITALNNPWPCIKLIRYADGIKQRLVFWRCMHRASSYNMYINKQDAQNSWD